MGMDFRTVLSTSYDPHFCHTMQPANTEKCHDEKYVHIEIEQANDAANPDHPHTFLLSHRNHIPSHRAGTKHQQQGCE